MANLHVRSRAQVQAAVPAPGGGPHAPAAGGAQAARALPPADPRAGRRARSQAGRIE